MDSAIDVASLKVPELRKELRQRGLLATGNKSELAERLAQALKSADDSLGNSGSLESDILEDDLLKDDDDEHQNSNETVLDCDVEKVLEETASTTSQTSNSNGVEKKPKRIKLERNIPIADESNDRQSEESVTKKPKSTIIKLSEISLKERLELRAKKFGVQITGPAKLLARAERFNSQETGLKLSDESKLKKRAERFGQATVNVANSDIQDKLEARKARFALGK